MGKDDNSTHQIGSLVQGYVRRKIKPGIHPALEALNENEDRFDQPPHVAMPHDEPPGSKDMMISRYSNIGNESNDDRGDVLEDLNNGAALERDSLQQKIVELGKTASIDGLDPHAANVQFNTWEEVLEEVNRASAIYNSRSGTWNRIRMAMRKFGENNQAFNAWLGLLPSNSADWVSVISGGLKLIIGSAARLADLRAEIADALVEIPFLMACVHKATHIFGNPRELRECGTSLYITTLKVLQHILSWYKKRFFVKLAGSILKQSHYNIELSSLIQDLKIQSARFEKCAHICSFGKITETSQRIEEHDRQSQLNHLELFDYVDSSFTLVRAENAMHQRVLRKYLEAFLGGHDRVDHHTYQAKGPILPANKKAISRRAMQSYLRARDEALWALDFDSSIVSQDVAICLHDVWMLPRECQDRIVAIMESPKVQTWVTTAHSSAIFINANASSHERLSSFIPANLAESVEKDQNNHAVTLSFFCDMHRHQNDIISGVSGLMRGLIFQILLSYPEFKLHTVSQISHGGTRDVASLCDIFYHLVLQLPPDVIAFCLVDEITTFESSSIHMQDSEMALNCLIDIVQQTQRDGCVFKLMVTSARNSRRLYKLIPEQTKNVVWIEGRVPPSGGFTPMKWGRSIGSHMDRISS